MTPTAFRSHCKYCGRGALDWMQIKGKWRMVDHNLVTHVCQSLINALRTEKEKRKQYE